MDSKLSPMYEADELTNSLVEAFCMAAETLDAPTIIKCIRAALEKEFEHHSQQAELYSSVMTAVHEN